MKTPDDKLTLKLKRSSIVRAKAEAKKRGTSVSRMVEEYFDHISVDAPKAGESEYSPRLKALMGIIKLQDGVDWKEERALGLMEKYGLK